MTTVRVVLPPHLKRLAEVGGEVRVDVEGPPTVGTVLDALERSYPMLRGTIRHQESGERRPMIRFFACGEDLSYQGPGVALPGPVTSGDDVLLVVGAIAGG